MTAFLFSGQGSQYTGMGKELLEANPEFSFIYDKASEILGYDLKKVTFEGTEEELAQTESMNAGSARQVYEFFHKS